MVVAGFFLTASVSESDPHCSGSHTSRAGPHRHAHEQYHVTARNLAQARP